MCGIVGYATRKSVAFTDEAKLERAMHKLLLLDVVRGEDSTGVAKIKEDGEVDIRKAAVPSYQFLDSKKMSNFVSATRVRGMIGHNRAATRGKVDTDNAHPFKHGHITLVHNGTLDTMLGLKGYHDTDSERICETMFEEGEKETLEKLVGAYALVWYNSEDESFNFARNNERPLWIWEINEDIVMWASEPWMLVGALSEPFKPELLPKNTMKPLKEGEWLKVFTTGKKSILTPFSIAQPVKTTYTDYRGGTVNNSSGREKRGKGSMESLGVKKGDKIMLRVSGKYNKNSEGNRVVAFGVVSQAPGIPDIAAFCHNTCHKTISKALDEGLMYFAATVGDDSTYTQNAILITTPFPVCGEKKFKSGKFPRKYDGVMKSYEEWAKVKDQLDSKDEPTTITFYDPNGNQISRKAMEAITKDGCAYCSHPIDLDIDDYEYYGDDVMHDKCVEQFEQDIEDARGNMQ